MSTDLALAAHLRYAQMEDTTKETDMTNTREVRIGDHKLKFIDNVPAILIAGTDEAPTSLTLEDVSALAEFAAEAWIALAEEGYRPVLITEKGYVVDEGAVL